MARTPNRIIRSPATYGSFATSFSFPNFEALGSFHLRATNFTVASAREAPSSPFPTALPRTRIARSDRMKKGGYIKTPCVNQTIGYQNSPQKAPAKETVARSYLM